MPQSCRFPGKRGKNIDTFQLPLAEAFAVNVHKVQSLTLEKAVVYLGKRHFAKGNFISGTEIAVMLTHLLFMQLSSMLPLVASEACRALLYCKWTLAS